jgi:AbiV family abortive infection protein
MEHTINFFSGYKLALENTKRLIASADAIAKISEFGPANSLLILAVEESVKAGFLFYCSLGSAAYTSPSDVIKLLRNHKHKHYFGYITRLFQHMADTLNKDGFLQSHLESRFSNIDQSNEQAIMKRLGEFVGDITSNLIESLGESMVKGEDIANRDWWRNANLLRNRGFYTDYDNNRWVSPSDLTKSDFENTRVIIASLLTEIEEFESLSKEGLSILSTLVSESVKKHRDVELDLPDYL